MSLTNVVFLIAYNCADIGTPIFFSHYFNPTSAASLTSTRSSTSATLPTGTATLTGTSTVVGTGTTATPTATSGVSGEPTSNNNTAALAGGIGGGIGGALLLIAAAFALWKYKSNKRKESESQLQPPAYNFQGSHSGAGGSSVGLRSMTTSPVYSNAYGQPIYHHPSNNGTSVWNHQAFQQGDAGAYYYKTDHGAPPAPPVELAGDNHRRNHPVEM